MISKNKATTSLSKLKKIEVEPREESGFRWKGVKHSDFVNAIFKIAELNSWKVNETRIRVWCDNKKMTGAVSLTRKGTQTITPWFGFASSNAGDKMLTFYAGGVEGDTSIVVSSWTGGAYTLNFDLKREMEMAYQAWEDDVSDLAGIIAPLKRTTISGDEYAKLLMAVGRKKVLPAGKIMRVDAAYREAGVKTLWGFQTAVCSAVSLTSGPQQMERLLKSYKLLCGFQRKPLTSGV